MMLDVYQTTTNQRGIIRKTEKIGRVNRPEDIVKLVPDIQPIDIDNGRVDIDDNGDGSFMVTSDLPEHNDRIHNFIISWDLYPPVQNRPAPRIRRESMGPFEKQVESAYAGKSGLTESSAALDATGHPININDTVVYSGNYLKSTNQLESQAASDRGTVVGIQPAGMFSVVEVEFMNGGRKTVEAPNLTLESRILYDAR